MWAVFTCRRSGVVAVGVGWEEGLRDLGDGIRDRQGRVKRAAGAAVTSANTSLLWTHQKDCDIL